MPVIIKSAATPDLLTVDATSKAQHITEYDSAAHALQRPSIGSYLIPIDFGAFTATIAASGVVWAMNTSPASSKTLSIRRIVLEATNQGSFLTSLAYDVARFRGSLGQVITPALPQMIIKKRTTQPNSSVVDVQFNAASALAATNLVVEPPFASLGYSKARANAMARLEVTFQSPDESYACFELAPGEGLCIKCSDNSDSSIRAGDEIMGFIEWDER